MCPKTKIQGIGEGWGVGETGGEGEYRVG